MNKEVEELVARSEAAVAEFPGHEGLAKVDAVIADLQVAMLDFLRLEEKRRIKREKEKERKERLRAEGKLLSESEKRKMAKQQAFLSTLGGEKGEGGEDDAEEEACRVRRQEEAAQEGRGCGGSDPAEGGAGCCGGRGGGRTGCRR